MAVEAEGIKLLRKHRIPYRTSASMGITALLSRDEVDLHHLRRLGFRVSRKIGDQGVVFYRGARFGLIL